MENKQETGATVFPVAVIRMNGGKVLDLKLRTAGSINGVMELVTETYARAFSKVLDKDRIKEIRNEICKDIIDYNKGNQYRWVGFDSNNGETWAIYVTKDIVHLKVTVTK